MKITNSELEIFRAEIINCLITFGNLQRAEAIELMDSAKMFENKSEMAVNLLFHELPYYWAMVLLHPEDSEWYRDKKLWPPPEGYR